MTNTKWDQDHHTTQSSTSDGNIPLLVIDGGATKTIAAITDEEGKILAKSKGNSSNYQVVGEESVLSTLEILVKDVLHQYFKKFSKEDSAKEVTIQRAVFALAGIDTQKDYQVLNNLVEQLLNKLALQIKEVRVENDALSVLLGATKGMAGVLLISGTGSISYVHDGKGNIYRVGGWGHILGDEGSGFWIGREALRLAMKMYDGRLPKTKLLDIVLEHLELKSAEDLYNWVYDSKTSVEQIASLAVVVEKARTLGDSSSINIIDRAIEELYQVIFTAINKAKLINTPFKLLLSGGVLKNNAYIRENLIQKIKNFTDRVQILTDERDPFEIIIQRGLQKDF